MFFFPGGGENVLSNLSLSCEKKFTYGTRSKKILFTDYCVRIHPTIPVFCFFTVVHDARGENGLDSRKVIFIFIIRFFHFWVGYLLYSFPPVVGYLPESGECCPGDSGKLRTGPVCSVGYHWTRSLPQIIFSFSLPPLDFLQKTPGYFAPSSESLQRPKKKNKDRPPFFPFFCFVSAKLGKATGRDRPEGNKQLFLVPLFYHRHSDDPTVFWETVSEETVPAIK